MRWASALIPSDAPRRPGSLKLCAIRSASAWLTPSAPPEPDELALIALERGDFEPPRQFAGDRRARRGPAGPKRHRD